MGKWVKDRLDSLGDIVAGGTPSTNVDAYWDGEIPFVTPYDLSKCAGVWIDKTARYITKAGLKNSAANLLPPQSIVISTRAPIGYIALTLEPSVSNQGCKSVVLKEDQDKVFHCYNLSAYVGEMKRLGVGTTFSEISKADLSRIKVCHPVSLDEQRHVAEILTTCDEVIEKSEAVAEKYRAIKAGMLKDLFTRGIGKNGKLRPPPESAPQLYRDTALGKVPREWEIKTIGEMFSFKNGVSKGKEYFGHGVPIVNFTDVFNKPRITPDALKGRVEMDRHEIESFAVKSGDVFFTRTSETPEEIGMAAVVIGEFVDTVFSGFVLRGRPISEDLEDEFKVFCFRTDAIRKRIVGDCSYTTRALTNGTKLSAIKMGVPSKCEQQRIAERLSAIDAKIADELAVVAKYRRVRAGLMARLLTPPDMEVE